MLSTGVPAFRVVDTDDDLYRFTLRIHQRTFPLHGADNFLLGIRLKQDTLVPGNAGGVAARNVHDAFQLTDVDKSQQGWIGR